uniref:Putative secreted protein n=1 Tax=Anopheles marajoara TaxID=58244 RepID=A0A2M4C6B7_9DIPT
MQEPPRMLSTPLLLLLLLLLQLPLRADGSDTPSPTRSSVSCSFFVSSLISSNSAAVSLALLRTESGTFSPRPSAMTLRCVAKAPTCLRLLNRSSPSSGSSSASSASSSSSGEQSPGKRPSNRSHPESDPESLKLPLRDRQQPTVVGRPFSLAAANSADRSRARRNELLLRLLPITPTSFFLCCCT